MDINRNIKKSIEGSGKTAYGIAKGLNQAPTSESIKGIMEGRTKNPGILTVLAIAQELGLTVSQLIGESEAPPAKPQDDPDTEVRKALLKHPRLSQKEAEFFYKLLEAYIKAWG